MATEADIQVPVCETRGDQVGNFVDNIINTSVSKLSLEKHTRDEQLNEHPTVQGENFLRPSSLTGEVHSKVNNASSDVSKVTEVPDQAVEDAANEGISAVEVQQNGEESSSTEKDEDNCTDSSVVISEMKVEDKLNYGGAKVATQLSNDTGSKQHGTNDSFTENIVLNKDIVQETDLPSEETELQAPFIAEGEEGPIEEEVSSNVTSEVSIEQESEQHKTTSKQDVLANERGAGENSSTAAEEASQKSCTPIETITTLETSNNNEVQSKSDPNASFSREEETTTENGEKIGATSEDSGDPLENTLRDSQGHEECQSKNLDDEATDHSIPILAEKSEEASLVQVHDSQKECDEHLEEKTEILPSIEVSTGDTNDNVPPATHNVKDKDEDIIKAEMSETPPETVHVTSENTERSDLSQENSIQDPPEDQTANVNMHGNTVEAEEATNDVVNRLQESVESCPPIVSSCPKEGSTNAVLQVTSNHVEVLENLSIAEDHNEISNVATDITEVTKEPDHKTASEQDLLANENNVEDHSNTAAGEASQEDSTSTKTIQTLETSKGDELQSKCESNSLSKEEEITLEKGDRSVTASENLEDLVTNHSYPNLTEKSEESSLVQTENSKTECDEHLEEKSEKLHLKEVGATDDNIPPVTDVVKEKNEDLIEAELSKNEPGTTCTSVEEDKQIETHATSLLVAPEYIEVSILSQEISITGPTQEQNTDAVLHGNMYDMKEATIDAFDQQKGSFESFPPIISSSAEEGSMNAVLQEVTSDHADEKIIDKVDRHAEVIENLTIGEAHSQVNKVAPEISEVAEKPDKSVELAADEEIQQNAEESNSTKKDGDRGVVPEQCNTDSLDVTSEVKARDTIDDLDADYARVVTSISKDTSSNEHSTNESFAKTSSLNEEILDETNIPSEEIESQAPCITEGDVLNAQVMTIGDKNQDEKPIEEDKSCNLTSEVTTGAESDQNNTTSEQEVLAIERSVAEDVSQENRASTETITALETSNSNTLQSNSDFTSSVFKEDEAAVQKSDRSLTTSDSLGENRDDIEYQPKTLKDAGTDHSNSKVAEKSEESPLDQIEDSQLECEEHLEVESEKLPLAVSENEQSTRCTLVKDDVRIEQEAKISEVVDQQKESLESNRPVVSRPPEEGSMDAATKEVTGDHTDDVVEEVDKHGEVLENFPTTGSTEDTKENSPVTLEGSENKKDDIGKESEGAPLPLPLAREVSEVLLNTEDSLNITSEDNKTPDLSGEIDTGSVIEEQHLTTRPQGILDKRSDGEIVDETEAKEDTLEVQNVATEITHENIEENSVSQVDFSEKKDEGHLEKDEEKPSLTDATIEEANSRDWESREISDDNTEREPIDEVQSDEESLEAKGIVENSLDCDKDPANDEDNSTKNTEHSLIKEEESTGSLQVTAKDIEETSLGQHTETKRPDEQSTIANSEAATVDKKEDIAESESGLVDETPKNKIIANTTQYEDKEENLLVQEDCSQLEQIEDLGNDSENKHLDDPKDYTIESDPVKEEAQVEKHVEEHIITADPQETCDKTQENTIDASDKKDDGVVNVQKGDNGDSSPIELDSSQDPSSEEALAEAINDDEPPAVNETNFANENTAKANLFEEENKIESALAKEEVCIESLQVGNEDIKANSLFQDREAIHLDEQAPTTDSQDHKDETKIHLADVKEKVGSDKDIAKSIPCEEGSPNVADGSQKPSLEEGSVENIDKHESTKMQEVKFVDESVIKADLIENEENTEATLIKEDVSIESPQVAAEDIKEPCLNEVRETNSQEEQILSADPRGLINDNETIDPTNFQKETPPEYEVSSKEIESVEKNPKVTADKIPFAEDLDVNENIIGKISEVSNYKQQEPYIMEVSEESTTTSHENASDNTSEKNNNQVVGEANTCGDKIDLEKVEVSNDGSTAVPTNEIPTDLGGSTEAEVLVPNQEKDKELSLPNSSECVSELEGADSGEKIDSNRCEEISGSSNSVAIEEDSTSNSSQEPRREIREEAETEEPIKQVMERDAQLCLESANDFDITDEVQNLKEVHLPAEEEGIVETTDCKESDVVEGASNNTDIGYLEQNDATESFSDDKKSDEEVLEKTVASDILQVSPSDTSGVDHCATEREVTNSEDPSTEKPALGDDEKLACDEKISDISSAAPHTTQTKDTNVVKLADDSDNMIDNAESQMVNENMSVESILVNERSATYLETKNDDEAPEIKKTTPSVAECQDLESASVEETVNYPCSLTEEKSNSDEVSFAPGENKIGHESNNQVIESIAVAENTSEQEETICEKEILKASETKQFPTIKAEDEGVKDCEQGSCKEDVIRDSHQADEIEQEQQSISKEKTKFTDDGNQTETVSKVSEEAIDKAPEDQEEKTLTNETIDEVLQQEEQAKSIERAVQIATIPADMSGEQNLKDDICSLDIVQAKDEENIMLSKGKSEEEAKEANTWIRSNEDEDKEDSIEAKKIDCASAVSDGAHIPKDNDVSTTKNTYAEEDYPSRSIAAEVSTGSEDIAPTEQALEATTITTEVQEAKAEIDLGSADPKSTEIESQEMEEINEKCTVTEGTSAPVELPVISTSKIIPEWTVGTPLEAEDQQTKLHDLPEEVDIKDYEAKISEKDDIVKLQTVRDTSKDVQELSKISFEVSNNQNAPVSETPEQETEEKQLRDTEDVQDAESSIHQSSVAATDQHEKREGSQQIDSPHSLPQAQCSDKETSEKELLVQVQGLDSDNVAELEATPLPLNDKHVDLEVDGVKNLNHEIEKPSKVEQEAECVNEDRLDQDMEGKPESDEIGKSSLSGLFQVSKRESTQIADHSATEKEPPSHTENLRAENSDEADHENSKTNDEKDDEEESHEQRKSDSVSEAPVMVDVADADVKVAHKKSHNILSGVGSKVKHSIAKVKKAITGKSSHPKPPSPKKVTD